MERSVFNYEPISDVLNDSVKATKVTGQISVIGFLAGQTTNLNLMQLIFRQTKIQGIAQLVIV